MEKSAKVSKVKLVPTTSHMLFIQSFRIASLPISFQCLPYNIFFSLLHFTMFLNSFITSPFIVYIHAIGAAHVLLSQQRLP